MTTTDPTKTGLVANEPLLVGAFVTWLLSFVGTLILGHTNLITSDQWSSLSTILVPVVSAAIIGAVAWVVRKFVSPAWKVLTKGTHALGIPDAVLEEIALNGVTQEIRDLAANNPTLAKIVAAIEANYHQAQEGDTQVPAAPAAGEFNGSAQAG